MKIDHEQDISYIEILAFFNTNMKKFVTCIATGIILGVATFFQMANFSASAIVTNDGSLDFVLLKRLQIELPRIAQHSELEYMRELSNDEWWQKNFKPNFAITKADVKEVQELNSKENRILSFSITTEENSEKAVVEKIENIIDFFKRSSTLIMARDLFQRYKLDVETKNSELDKNEQGGIIEINYMKNKAKNLEEIKNKFQQNTTTINSQVLDPKESGSKYLPINTQLIAIYSDIAAQNEIIERIKDERSFLVLKNKLTDEFFNSSDKNHDGFAILSNIRKRINTEMKITSTDNQEALRQSMALKKIDTEIANIQSKFQTGLGEQTPIKVKRNSLLKHISLGAAFGLIIGFIYALTITIKTNFNNRPKEA